MCSLESPNCLQGPVLARLGRRLSPIGLKSGDSRPVALFAHAPEPLQGPRLQPTSIELEPYSPRNLPQNVQRDRRIVTHPGRGFLEQVFHVFTLHQEML